MASRQQVFCPDSVKVSRLPGAGSTTLLVANQTGRPPPRGPVQHAEKNATVAFAVADLLMPGVADRVLNGRDGMFEREPGDVGGPCGIIGYLVSLDGVSLPLLCYCIIRAFSGHLPRPGSQDAQQEGPVSVG